MPAPTMAIESCLGIGMLGDAWGGGGGCGYGSDAQGARLPLLLPAEPLIVCHDRLAQQGEVARVHGRILPAVLVLVEDRRDVQGAFDGDLKEMQGIDGLDEAQAA